MPPSISAGDDSDEEELTERKKRDSFVLSQSGTFKTEDFVVNRLGMSSSMSSMDGRSPSMGDRRASFGGGAADAMEVKSMEELDILEEIGSGASGTVHKAKHKPTGVMVAVKSIQILEKARRDQMVSELRIMRQHESPWLVSLHNAFYEDAKVYMVLEFMDMGSLEALVEKHKGIGLKNELELAKMGTQMLNGLNYLHKVHHQVHRDLKPANVLISKQGEVKITDFGAPAVEQSRIAVESQSNRRSCTVTAGG